jgi:hypothetical protein
MTAQVGSAEAIAENGMAVDLVAPPSQGASGDARPTIEGVASIVAGYSIVGEAQHALIAAGWNATIAANRITVGEDILAELIPATTGTYGLISARWVIYSVTAARPVWVVGAEPPLSHV